MFGIEVEFLTGVSVAASPYQREEPEWPPHPDRLFQALVAAWGRNDQPDTGEKQALEWLETLDRNTLEIHAPRALPRTVTSVFVPPNDARTTGRAGSRPPRNIYEAVRVVPDLRKNRQPRAFPAVIVDPSISGHVRTIRYVWRDAGGVHLHREALGRLAREITYLGHSHTLVRATLIDDIPPATTDDMDWIVSESTELRCPYKGRLEHLEYQYRRSIENSVAARPNPSLVTRRYRTPSAAVPPTTLFDGENIVAFEDTDGFCPSLTAFPLVAKRLRDALLRIADGRNIPISTLLSGHAGDMRPTTRPHISIVPLADVGWEYSQGRLMGLAIVWPRTVEAEDRHNVLKVLAEFAQARANNTGVLHFGRNGSWRLSLSPEPRRESVRVERYVKPAKRWGTVLPAVLDRHPKDKPDQDVSAIIGRACRNVGLKDDVIAGLKVKAHRYPAVRGAPSVRDVARTLPHDSPYRGRPLTHLVLDFPRQIQGPLLLGAGRFRGLGLCLPLE